MEEWRPIEDYGYEASSLGRIRNSKTCRIMSFRVSAHGYAKTDIRVEGKNKTFQYHRLVAMAWHENPGGKPQVDHIDKDKLNNRPDNLRWVTAKENCGNKSNNLPPRLGFKLIQDILDLNEDGLSLEEIYETLK